MKTELIEKLLELALATSSSSDSVAAEPAAPTRYVLVRTYSAGVHAGWLVSHSGREVVLGDSRRIWRWRGAAELCQIAQCGLSTPDHADNLFSVRVSRITLTEAIEIIDCSPAGQSSIEGVPEWKQ